MHIKFSLVNNPVSEKSQVNYVSYDCFKWDIKQSKNRIIGISMFLVVSLNLPYKIRGKDILFIYNSYTG